MKFDNSQVRRQDRLLCQKRAMEILSEGQYGILSIADGGAGYGVPMNYALDGDSIYFHSAPTGKKVRLIGTGAEVSFCVVGNTRVEKEKFTTGYESVIAFGRAAIVADDEERMQGLRLLLKKYSPEFYESGLKYSGASFGRVAVIRLDINSVSAKSKPLAHKEEGR